MTTHVYEYRAEILTTMETVAYDLINSDWIGTRPQDLKDVETKWKYLNALSNLYYDANLWGMEKVRPHFEPDTRTREIAVRSKMVMIKRTLEPVEASN